MATRAVVMDEVRPGRTTQPAEDALLIRRGLKGDQEALETLFSRYKRSLYQTALRLLGNPEEAEDALQDGMLSAYRNLRWFEGRSQFSTWLTRIVINAALMRRRRGKARPAVSLDEPLRPAGTDRGDGEMFLAERLADDGPTPEQAYEQTELREMLRENLGELSPLLQTAFVLRDVEGFSTGEAASELGVTENTLKARLWRARHQLAERLGRRLRRRPDSTRPDPAERCRCGSACDCFFGGGLCGCEGA